MNCFLVDVGEGVSMHTFEQNFLKVLFKQLSSLKSYGEYGSSCISPLWLSLPHPLPKALYLLFHHYSDFYQHISFRHSSRKRPADGSEISENPVLIILVFQACPLGASIYPTRLPWNSTVE